MASTDSITFPAKTHTHSEYMKNTISSIDINKYAKTGVSAWGLNNIIVFDNFIQLSIHCFTLLKNLSVGSYFTLFDALPITFLTDQEHVSENFIELHMNGAVNSIHNWENTIYLTKNRIDLYVGGMAYLNYFNNLANNVTPATYYVSFTKIIKMV